MTDTTHDDLIADLRQDWGTEDLFETGSQREHNMYMCYIKSLNRLL